MEKNVFLDFIVWDFLGFFKSFSDKNSCENLSKPPELVHFRALSLLDATSLLVTNEWFAAHAARSAHALSAFRCGWDLTTGQTIQLNPACVVFFIFLGAKRLQRDLLKRNVNWTRAFGLQRDLL